MELQIEYIRTDEIKPYAGNAKLHPAEQVEQIKRSIEEFGFNDPVAVWKDNEIIEGHGRLIAAVELGMDMVPVIRLDELTDEQRRAYMLVHNKLTMNSDFDKGLLSLELDEILDIDMSQFGFDPENIYETDDYQTMEENKGSMADKYIVPPFSVIYANKPDWLSRKRAWIAKGLHSEIGRDAGPAFNSKSDQKANFKAGERGKAFKNNTALNSYMKKRGAGV